MKIVIDDRIPFIKGVFEPWAEVVYCRGSTIDRRVVADADALIVRTRTRCDAALLEGSSVRMVATATIGYDHLDTGWMAENGTGWTSAPGCNSGSVMQYVVSLLFFLFRRYSLDPARLTLGIAGVGNVGRKVAAAAEALGMRVLLNDPPRQRREGTAGFVGMDELLALSDIVTLHVPLTREGEDKTHHLIDDKRLAALRPETIIINTARGEVIDNRALLHALHNRQLRGAALDVWEGEPAADPRLIAATVVATPHIAGYSADGKANATISSVRSVAEALYLPLTRWEPASMPQPAEPVIDLTGRHESSIWLAGRAVEHTYRVEDDDRLFRESVESFEMLRDNYRIRREFSAYRVRTDDQAAAAIMAQLGFQIMESNN